MEQLRIRNILETLSSINESTGLAGRSKGAVFKNENDDQLIFQELKFYPADGGKFTPEELELELKKFPNVSWMNKKTPKTGGFGIATFNDDKGKLALIAGQFMEKINPNFKNNYISNTVFGYSLDTKTAKKAKEKLKPQDLLSEKVKLSIPMIMNQLAKSLGTDNSLYLVAHKLASGEPLPYTFPKAEGYTFVGFRDYFCEILQPIALQMGQYTGNAGEAAEKFLDGSFQKTTISFDDSVTAGLSDSTLTNKDGKYVLISTKGGDGAKASAKNLYDKILMLETTSDGVKFLSKYSDEVDIIKNIVKYGQNGSPLYLGVKFDVIDEQEAEQIRMLRNKALVNLNNIDSIPISDRLKQFAKERNTKTPENTDLYYHIIASVAEKSAEKVNKDTNFSKAATDILNNAGLIQVYTEASDNGDTWTLKEFNTKYPSDTTKGVYLNSSKTYYSTDIKGNFTFLIDKGKGIPKDTEPETSTAIDMDQEKIQRATRANVTKVFKGKEKTGAGRARRSAV